MTLWIFHPFLASLKCIIKVYLFECFNLIISFYEANWMVAAYLFKGRNQLAEKLRGHSSGIVCARYCCQTAKEQSSN